MNSSLINSAASMSGLQRRMDIIAHNIANVNTVGYKRKEATFQDILTSRKQQLDDMQLPGRLTPLGLTEGWGSRLSKQLVDMSQGFLQATDNPTDIALQGDAMFELAVPLLDGDGQPIIENGEPAYQATWTRYGSFKLTSILDDPDNMYLTTEDGQLVLGADGERIAIPQNHRLSIDQNGKITAYNHLDEAVPAGQLRLVKVLNPQLLESLGEHHFGLPANVERDVAFLTLDDAEAVALEGIGVRQGFLEQSNVSMVNEMTELISIQRSYQMSARALSSADTMMNLANNLRGT